MRRFLQWTPPFTLALLGITAAGLFLRLLWLDQATFAFDQAQISLRALAMARSGVFAYTAPNSSVGPPHLPVSIWFFALLHRFTVDPLPVTAVVALLNAASVIGVGLIGRRALGNTGGLAAAALYALSPWAIFFSRSIWQPDLMAPLAVLWAYAAIRAQDDKWPWLWVGLCVMCAGLAPQVHYAGVALWPATLWVLIRGRWWERGRWPGLAAGAGAALLCLAPFVYAIWPQRAVHWAALRSAGPGWRVSAEAVRGMLQMASGLEWPTIVLGASAGLPGGIWALQRATAWLLLGGCVAGLLLLVMRALGAGARAGEDPDRRRTATLIVLWAVTASLLFTVHSTPAYHHYLLAALPAFYLAAGALASRLAERRWGRAALALLVVAGITQAAFYVAALHGQRQAAENDPYSLGLQRAVLAALPPDGPLIVASDCDAHEVCHEASVWEVRLWDREHRSIDGRHALLLPGLTEGQGATLLLSPSSGALYDSWGHSAAPLGEVGPYRLADVEAGWASSLVGWTAIEPLTLSAGAQLQAWRTEREGDTVRLWTLWRIVGPPPPGQIQQFNHLYLGEDRVSGQDYAVSSRAWRPGDWLVTWADLSAPANAESLAFDVGMYDLGTMQRASILERPEDTTQAIRLE
ncbi:MAG: glycosyltransferase family 39 protein [Anaerolineae bacterium]